MEQRQSKKSDRASRAETDLNQCSTEFYKSMVEQVGDYAMFIMNTAGRIIAWNRGAVNIFGFSAAEAIGQPGALIYVSEDRGHNVPEKEMEKAAREGRAQDIRWHQRKDGSRVWAEGILMSMKDDDEQIYAYAKIVTDATRRKELEDERDRLLEETRRSQQDAEAANLAKSEFIATTTHELRNPLAAISGWMGLLYQRSLSEEELQTAYDTIIRNVKSLQMLIDDLAEFTRLDFNKVHLAVEPVDLRVLLTEVVHDMRFQTAAKALNVHLKTEQPIGPIRCDRVRIHQVVINLVANAVKFTPPGGTIEIQLGSSGMFASIKVTDSGIGIEAELLPHIFNRFQQAELTQVKNQGGLGLGLYIAHELVKLHGGHIEVESAGKNKGTTFTILLPFNLPVAQ